MSAKFAYDVSTKLLLDQAKATIDELQAPSNRVGVTALKQQGLDVERFLPDLKKALDNCEATESEQERLKQRYLEEAREDQTLADAGYRWLLSLHAKARHAMATHEGELPDLAGSLLFGKLRRPRMRGVLYNLRIVLPELDELAPLLKPFGVDEVFVARGQQILERAGVERSETAATKAERQGMTQQVRKAEQRLSQLLHQVDMADAAAALDAPEARRYFSLQLIHTERARLEAERAAREVSRPANLNNPSATDDE